MFFIWSTFFISHKTAAQQLLQQEFSGFLKLKDSSVITYKISFKLTDNSHFKGNSVTDVFGTEKTTTFIQGEWNKNKNLISFNEISNISTKSQANHNEFCYIHVKNARVKSKGGKTNISGEFTGFFENGAPCASGKLFLIGTDFLYQKTSGKDSTKLADAEPIKKLLEKGNETKLQSGESFTFKTNSSSVKLELWDGMKEDNDRITVLIDNKAILTDFELSRNKKIIEIPLVNHGCIIDIIAENEGLAPPNTANIILKDEQHEIPLVSSLKKGEKTSVKILTSDAK